MFEYLFFIYLLQCYLPRTFFLGFFQILLSLNLICIIDNNDYVYIKLAHTVDTTYFHQYHISTSDFIVEHIESLGSSASRGGNQKEQIHLHHPGQHM